MKKNRTIKKKEEFTAIIQKRNIVSEPALAFYYLPKQEPENRVGISITTKLGNAVERNKAKRQLREMIEEVFDWQESFDSVIVIKAAFKDFSYLDNKKCLERCYKKVKIETVKDKVL